MANQLLLKQCILLGREGFHFLTWHKYHQPWILHAYSKKWDLFASLTLVLAVFILRRHHICDQYYSHHGDNNTHHHHHNYNRQHQQHHCQPNEWLELVPILGIVGAIVLVNSKTATLHWLCGPSNWTKIQHETISYCWRAAWSSELSNRWVLIIKANIHKIFSSVHERFVSAQIGHSL